MGIFLFAGRCNSIEDVLPSSRSPKAEVTRGEIYAVHKEMAKDGDVTLTNNIAAKLLGDTETGKLTPERAAHLIKMSLKLGVEFTEVDALKYAIEEFSGRETTTVDMKSALTTVGNVANNIADMHVKWVLARGDEYVDPVSLCGKLRKALYSQCKNMSFWRASLNAELREYFDALDVWQYRDAKNVVWRNVDLITPTTPVSESLSIAYASAVHFLLSILSGENDGTHFQYLSTYKCLVSRDLGGFAFANLLHAVKRCKE